MLSRFEANSFIKPDHPNSAIKIRYKNQKIEAELYQRTLHEKVVMDSGDSEFWNLLDGFMKIQKNQMSLLKIQFDEDSTEDATKNEILKKLENLLESKSIQTRRLFLEVSDSNQAVSILNHLDLEFLGKLEVKIPNSDRKIDIDGFKILVDWKRTKPLKFALRMDKIFDDNLKSINQLFLRWTVFTEIDLIYKDFESNPVEFFDVPFEIKTSENSENLISFRMSHGFRFAPSLVKLTLSNEKSARVLENPVIMEKIVKYFKFFDIQRLLKTSSGIRSCVDHLKPDPKIEEYLMVVKSEDYIGARISDGGYRGRLSDVSKDVVYEKKEDSDDIVSRALNDFETNFKNQETCMEEFKLVFTYYDQTKNFARADRSESVSESFKTLIEEKLNPMTSKILDGIQSTLQNRTEPLKVRKLVLMSVRPSDAMKILPYLDAGCLNFIEIRDPYSEFWRVFNRRENYPISLQVPFDIQKIAKTEQWRNAKQLEVHCDSISTPVQKMNLTGFSRIYVSDIQQITSEDVAYLKENLISSSKLERFIISFKEFVGRENLHDLVGVPTRIYTDDSKTWYFRFKEDKDKSLEISLRHKTIYFERVWEMRHAP